MGRGQSATKSSRKCTANEYQELHQGSQKKRAKKLLNWVVNTSQYWIYLIRLLYKFHSTIFRSCQFSLKLAEEITKQTLESDLKLVSDHLTHFRLTCSDAMMSSETKNTVITLLSFANRFGVFEKVFLISVQSYNI